MQKNVKNMITIEIPCTSLVRGYIEAKTKNRGVFTLSRKNPVGNIIIDLLEKPSRENDHKIPTDIGNTRYHQRVQLQINETISLRDGVLITRTNLTRLNKRLTKRFFEEYAMLLAGMELSNPGGKLKKKALFAFCKQIGMDDSFVTYDTVQKIYNRSRKRAAAA